MTTPLFLTVMTVRSDAVETARPLLQEMSAASRGEAGCTIYDTYESAATPGLFFSLAQWQQDEDIETHGKAEHVTSAFAALSPMFDGEVVIHPLVPQV